jgi:hypothetical protein
MSLLGFYLQLSGELKLAKTTLSRLSTYLVYLKYSDEPKGKIREYVNLVTNQISS